MHKKTEDRNQKPCFKADTKEEKERKKENKTHKTSQKFNQIYFSELGHRSLAAHKSKIIVSVPTTPLIC